MRRVFKVSGFLALLVVVAMSTMSLSRAGAEPKKAKEKPGDIYDRTANGAQQIKEALALAKHSNKHVLVQFGANWCSWCHKLHELFKSDKAIAKKLLYEYVVVLIDVDKVKGKAHNEEVVKRYGNPTIRGVPAIVVLDADGKQLCTLLTEEWEEGPRHVPERVLAFLTKWQPKPVAAGEVLSHKLAEARSKSKKVFVYFSAPWCPWCKTLDEYLQVPDIARVFDAGFVTARIDVDRMTGGKKLDDEYRRGVSGGLPYFAVLDGDGRKLADSNCLNEQGKKANVGFPVAPWEVAHFIKVVREACPSLAEQQFATLERGLKSVKPGH